MKEWLLENYRLIIEVVLLITSVIIMCIKKKPVKVVDGIKSTILRLLPGCINQVEIDHPGIASDQKLNFCISLCWDALKQLGFTDEVIAVYRDFIIEQVEAILSTPQKKGITGNEKSKKN